ncbi:MAG TPA: TetR/AcrR family transcriptional regulator [Candidatus Brocadiia bacterium]|nr:TetR/AcrR family transcriptional regulator [Candidatus Brocadiia bacterium]
MSPIKVDVEEKKRQILLAAARVFASSGFQASTVAAVARKAGVSKGSIYDYFKSKREMFVMLVQEMLRQDAEEISKIATGAGSAREKIESVFESWVAKAREWQELSGLMLEFWAEASQGERSGSLSRFFNKSYKDYHRMLKGLLDEGISNGEFRADTDCDQTAAMVIACLDGVLLQSALDRRLGEVGPLKDTFLQFLLQGIARPGDAPAGTSRKGARR